MSNNTITPEDFNALLQQFGVLTLNNIGGYVAPPPAHLNCTWSQDEYGNLATSSAEGLFAGLLFTPTIESSGFTEPYNQSSTFVASDMTRGIQISDPVGTSPVSNWEGIAMLYPSQPFTLTMLVSCGTLLSGCAYGVSIMSSLTGPLEVFFVDTSLGNVDVGDYTSPATWAATPFTHTFPSWPFYWLRLRDNGTTITYSVSSDGVRFDTVYSVAKVSNYLNATGFNWLALAVDTYYGPVSTLYRSITLTTP